MRMSALCPALAAAAAFVVMPTCGLAQSNPAPQVEAWSLERTSRIGQAMYDQDLLAIRASEALGNRFPAGEPIPAHGWIVVDTPSGPLVRFFSAMNGRTQPLYDVPFRRGRATGVIETTDTAYPPEQEAAVQARLTAIRNVGQLRCGQFNSIILPDEEQGGWLVWLMATANDATDSARTGHYRFLVSRDGRTLIRRDQLFSQCVNLPRSHGILTMYRQDVADRPLETDVFVSLVDRMPACVIAGSTLYSVVGSRITSRGAGRVRGSNRTLRLCESMPVADGL